MKWLAGVRPRSIGTTSAIASRPGVRARIAAPSSAGTLPPATGSKPMLIVPPGEHDRDAGTTVDPLVSPGRPGRTDRSGGRPRPGATSGRRAGLADIRLDGASSADRQVGRSAPSAAASGSSTCGSALAPATPRFGSRRNTLATPDARAPRADDEHHRAGADQVRDRADDDDRQEARHRHEHVQHAEHPAADVLRQVLLELRLGRDRDERRRPRRPRTR